jgi:hypothetical protein
VFFLLDRYAPAQRSTRQSASVASYVACRDGLTGARQTIAVIIYL